MKSHLQNNAQKASLLRLLLALCCNALLLVVCYFICRIAFYLENYSYFGALPVSEAIDILRGGLRFDLSAIAYSNALYLLLLFFPLHGKEARWWPMFLRILFVSVNTICLSANLADAVYFPFIKRRATASIFTEFQNDDLTNIIGIEFVNHWYLTLLALILAVALWFLYRTPKLIVKPRWKYYLIQVIGLLLSALLLIGGMRGGFDPELRPLHNGHAREYVITPTHAVLVTNTPFSIFRTSSKKGYPEVHYFEESQLEQIYTPIHELSYANDTIQHHKDNVVIIVLESFSTAYSKHLNPYAEEGYTPFLDSLMREGLTYDLSLSNGISSIDAQASVFASIPMLIESFMSSRATMNDLDGIGNYLKPLGYTTAFFHGADNGSLSIDGFVKACGMDAYYGRREFNNDAEWDHHWGIWDEPFMQFMAQTLSHTPEPFCAGLFTVTSHHPFQIPPQYRDTFPEGNLPIYKAIRYTDHSLRHFFETAKQQSWYPHTLFVLTGDHINMQPYAELSNDLGAFMVPVFFYHPTDTTWRGHRAGIIQQTDILPTVLHHVGYQGTYFSFGNDLLNDAEEHMGALSYIHDQYQFVQDHYLLQFDGEKTTAFYDFRIDPLLQNNQVVSPSYVQPREEMETKLKAAIQQYMSRMNANRICIRQSQQSQ